MRFDKARCLLFALLLALAPAAWSQTVTGSVSGTVVDAGGAVVVGASVTLTNDVSKQARDYKTDSNGEFTFISMLPGAYTLKVVQPGFKAYQQSNVSISAQERVDLHTIRLTVGDVSTSIEVLAEAAHVATDSSDRAQNINLTQIADTPVRGRDFLGILKTLPGVQDLGNHDSRGWGGNLPTINGGQSGQVVQTLDGIVSQDSGAPNLGGYIAPSVDAIGEVKLLVSNYTAEYGARNGGQLNITIKSGTNQYHGSAYYDWRHESIAANEWFNNKLGVAKPRYRYQNPGGTFGGPLVIPGVRFNKDRNRLFFFFSYDKLINHGITGPTRYTMPTALERQGDFSASVNANGTPILIRDPNTGAACTTAGGPGCFAGNRVPASRINAIGQAYLNKFPTPNFPDPTGQRQYNFQFIGTNDQPREDKILRVDYNATSKDTMFVRLLQDYQDQSGHGAILGPANNGGNTWGQFTHSYHIPSAGMAGTWVHTFRPNLINELTAGLNRAHQGNSPIGDGTFEASLLPLKDSGGNALKMPNLFGANALNLLSQVNFGLPSGFTAQSAPTAIPGLPAYGFDSRWPFDGTDQATNITDTVTYIKGTHTMKAGFYHETSARNVSVYSVYNTAGTYYLGSDLGNPVDTGNPFSNLITGNLYGYGEDNKKQINRARYRQVEWFIQDTWKIHRRVTLDAGIRFQFLGALRSQDATLGIFDQSSYKAGAQLLYPHCTVPVGGTTSCPVANKASINPATGRVYPYAQQGTFDPASFASGGLPFSGILQKKTMLFDNPPLQYGPRIGLAWDVFGDGKTALRTGFGIFYGRAFGVDTIGATGAGVGPIAAPPNFVAPLILNTNINQLVGAPAVYTPQATTGGSLAYKPPSTYNWSFGIQRDLGLGLVLDVTYVGNVAHNQFNQGRMDFNAVRPYTTWNPTTGANSKYFDPTSGGGGTAGFYSTNLIRALSGGYNWGAIQMYTQDGASNYNALQVTLNRRFSKRLQLGANYTWSKTITYNRNQWVDDKLLKNVTTNRPHAVNLNWGYDIPGITRFWNNPVAKHVFDGWHWSGSGTLFYGQALAISCSANGAPIGYWTGTPTGGFPFRCQQNGSLWLDDGATPSSVYTGVNNSLAAADRRLWYPFRAASFTLPAANSFGIGNAQPTMTYGPGVINFDWAIQKDIVVPVRERNVTMTLKAEFYNVFNHFNPGNPNTALAINCAASGGFCTNPTSLAAYTSTTFGTITTAAVQARHAALTMRVRF